MSDRDDIGHAPTQLRAGGSRVDDEMRRAGDHVLLSRLEEQVAVLRKEVNDLFAAMFGSAEREGLRAELKAVNAALAQLREQLDRMRDNSLPRWALVIFWLTLLTFMATIAGASLWNVMQR